MANERQQAVAQPPKAPSLILWLMLGVSALLSGVLLFWLHNYQLMGALQNDDIHLLSILPFLIWVILLSFRGWFYNIAFHRYWLEFNESEHK